MPNGVLKIRSAHFFSPTLHAALFNVQNRQRNSMCNKNIRRPFMFDIVDTHTHAISPDQVRYPLAPVGGHQSDWSAHRPADYETLLAAMDEAGIARAMVVQASTAYGNDNRYVVEAVNAHPDRFAGVFSIDVLAPDNVTQMQRWIDAGMSG